PGSCCRKQRRRRDSQSCRGLVSEGGVESMKTPKKAVTTMMALMMGCLIGAASAKLPAPPPVDPAVAEAAKKKAADAAKMQADQLAKVQDRVAERYKKQKGGAAAAPKK